ncbi:hypothetical protein [Paenibacillus wenxiniae]|uniref:Uncharacterized protein n=1 Tax=Paenibacillus wenxiniae TaxID=1636843 RepID=A0ABW4RNG1_9BACL
MFDLIGIQTRYLKLLEELEYYDSQRAKMLALYARYKEDKQAGIQQPYLQRQADIVNHLSFNVIEKSIQHSAPIQEFIDYVAELHDQMYE